MDQSTDELLLVEPLESMAEEFDMRTALLTSHPCLSLSTRLLDAHIYVFRRTVLDLLATRRPRDLASIREQFVPWLIKGAWQSGLSRRWASSELLSSSTHYEGCTLTLVLDPPGKDVLAKALARSTTAKPSLVPYLDSSPSSSPSTPQASLPATTPASPQQTDMTLSIGDMSLSGADGAKPRSKPKRKADWKCQYIVIKPEISEPPAASAQNAGGKGKDKNKAPAPEQAYLIRANSLAGYWELNRRFLRSIASSTPVQAPLPVPSSAEEGGVSPIHPSAQISPDSLIGEGTKVGERASIKKCVVGRHCNIGRGAKVTGCVIWDFVTIEEK